jgi:hypothetical protein
MLTRAVELMRALSARRIPRRRIQFGQRLEHVIDGYQSAGSRYFSKRRVRRYGGGMRETGRMCA